MLESICWYQSVLFREYQFCF